MNYFRVFFFYKSKVTGDQTTDMFPTERVIGALKNPYHILDGPLPMRLVKSLMDERQNREEAMTYRIVHVCAALVNMSGSVMYSRY